MPHWLEKVITLLQADTSDLRELARMAGSNPRIFYRGISLADLELSGQDLQDMEFAEGVFEDVKTWPDYLRTVLDANNDKVPAIKMMQTVHQVKRQEERLAILLDLILRNPNNSLFLISLYSKDRAKYANLILKQIETELKAGAAEGTLFTNETVTRKLSAVQLARIVNRQFSHGMPDNRAALLYYMAKHLAKYPDINRYLRAKLAKARSIFIVPHRREILQFLDQGDEISEQA